MEKVRALKDRLERQFSLVGSLQDPKGVFLELAEYMDIIDKELLFDGATETIISGEKRDHERLNLLRQKVRKEVRDAFQSIHKKIKAKKIGSAEVKKLVTEFEEYESGERQSSEELEESLYYVLVRLIDVLLNEGYEDIVSDYVDINPERIPQRIYKISESFFDFGEERKDLLRKKESTVWGAYDELVLLWRLADRKRTESYIEDLKRKGPTVMGMNWRAINFAGQRREVEGFLEGRESARRRVYPEGVNFLRYARKLHHYLLGYLEDLSRRERFLEVKKLKLRFWLDGRVEVRGSEGKLAPKTQSYELLRALIEKYNDDPKAWLKPLEAWEVVYGDEKKAGKWNRRLQSGPYRNLKKALAEITDAELIEIKDNAIKIKA